jgi:hypothetical protein
LIILIIFYIIITKLNVILCMFNFKFLSKCTVMGSFSFVHLMWRNSFLFTSQENLIFIIISVAFYFGISEQGAIRPLTQKHWVMCQWKTDRKTDSKNVACFYLSSVASMLYNYCLPILAFYSLIRPRLFASLSLFSFCSSGFWTRNVYPAGL